MTMNSKSFRASWHTVSYVKLLFFFLTDFCDKEQVLESLLPSPEINLSKLFIIERMTKIEGWEVREKRELSLFSSLSSFNTISEEQMTWFWKSTHFSLSVSFLFSIFVYFLFFVHDSMSPPSRTISTRKVNLE